MDVDSGVINMGTVEVNGKMALISDGEGDAIVVNDVELDFATATVDIDTVSTVSTGR